MNDLSYHLKKIVKINRQILNQLHKDEATVSSIRQAIDEREVHTQKLNELVPEFDTNTLTKQESDSIKALFDRFDQQSKKIEKALDYIMEESKKKLGDAIKHRKAEESYQFVK